MRPVVSGAKTMADAEFSSRIPARIYAEFAASERDRVYELLKQFEWK